MVGVGGSRPGRCRATALAPDPRLRRRRAWKHWHVASNRTNAGWCRSVVRGTGRPMTSFRQFEANRRNALKSTGPKSLEGKRISRRNALRHGLIAETAIDGLEDSEDYRGFEAAITSDYNAERRSNANSCCVLRRFCGACIGSSQSRPICFRFVHQSRVSTKSPISPIRSNTDRALWPPPFCRETGRHR
jgi:hypothetical protein